MERSCGIKYLTNGVSGEDVVVEKLPEKCSIDGIHLQCIQERTENFATQKIVDSKSERAEEQLAPVENFKPPGRKKKLDRTRSKEDERRTNGGQEKNSDSKVKGNKDNKVASLPKEAADGGESTEEEEIRKTQIKKMNWIGHGPRRM